MYRSSIYLSEKADWAREEAELARQAADEAKVEVERLDDKIRAAEQEARYWQSQADTTNLPQAERDAAWRKATESREEASRLRQQREEAQRKADEKERNAQEKDREADETEKAAEEKAPKDDELDPEDAFNSEACREAMGDPSDRVLSERLGADWVAWNETRGRLPHLWDPAPDDLQPYDALRLPFCGGDEETVNYLEEQCDIPVDCFEGRPDENCGCDGAPTEEARLVASIAANACRNYRCPDGTIGGVGQGLVCVCAEEPGEKAPERLPRPSPPVVAALFGNGSAKVPHEGSSARSSKI